MRDEVKNQSGSLALEKSFAFALRIIRLYQHLSDKKKEFVLSKQILRAGTSIGANLEESRGAQSSSDFQAKISIAYKEARETSCWLRLVSFMRQNTSPNVSSTAFTAIVKISFAFSAQPNLP